MSATAQMNSNSGSLSSTLITPLAATLLTRLQRAASFQSAIPVESDPAISQAFARLVSPATEPEPAPEPATEPATQQATEPKKEPLKETGSMNPPRPERRPLRRQLLRWGLAALMGLSLVGNGVYALAPRGAEARGEKPLEPVQRVAVESQPPSSAPAALDASSCVRDSAEPASCGEREQLLLQAIRDYEAGRRDEALRRFKRYAGEVCDRTTLQTIGLLGRELSRPSEGIVRTP